MLEFSRRNKRLSLRPGQAQPSRRNGCEGWVLRGAASQTLPALPREGACFQNIPWPSGIASRWPWAPPCLRHLTHTKPCSLYPDSHPIFSLG